MKRTWCSCWRKQLLQDVLAGPLGNTCDIGACAGARSHTTILISANANFLTSIMYKILPVPRSRVVQQLYMSCSVLPLPAGRALSCRICNLSLSRHTSVDTSQVGGIRWLDLDSVEQRYLLTAAADSTLEAFDVLVSNSNSNSGTAAAAP